MEVEWLILADSVQVVGDKLYLLGGGWDVLTTRKSFPFNQPCGIAIAVNIPWNETNQRHRFEVGRPPGIPSGQNQRMQFTVNMGIKIKTPGIKTVIARIDGTESKRISFNVLSTTK